MTKCTGANCPFQFDSVDPANCKAVDSCQYATRMRDYSELVKDLRCHAGTCEYKETECSRYNKRFDDTDYTTCSEELCDDAADAIEELLAIVKNALSLDKYGLIKEVNG